MKKGKGRPAEKIRAYIIFLPKKPFTLKIRNMNKQHRQFHWYLAFQRFIMSLEIYYLMDVSS